MTHRCFYIWRSLRVSARSLSVSHGYTNITHLIWRLSPWAAASRHRPRCQTSLSSSVLYITIFGGYTFARCISCNTAKVELPAADWPVGGWEREGRREGERGWEEREIKKDEKDGDCERVRGWERGRIRFRYTSTDWEAARGRRRCCTRGSQLVWQAVIFPSSDALEAF